MVWYGMVSKYHNVIHKQKEHSVLIVFQQVKFSTMCVTCHAHCLNIILIVPTCTSCNFIMQEWLDTRCQDTVSLVTLWTRLHVWSQPEKVGSFIL